MKRPAEIPARFLPYLAWELSVSVWYDDWPEWKKRKAARVSLPLHRIGGTLPAIEGWLDLVDARVVKATLPPEGCFVRRNRTRTEREAFAAQFAQLRIYPFRAPGRPPLGAAYAGHRGKGWVGRRFLRINTARDRYGPRATLFDRGAERPVRWQLQSPVEANGVAVAAERITVPATARRNTPFIGHGLIGHRRSFCETRGTESRIYTIGVDRTPDGGSRAPMLAANGTGLDVLSTKPERVLGRAPAPGSCAFVVRTARRFVRENRAAERIFDRWHLYDPDRVVRQRRLGGGSFIDRSIIELSPFRAELVVALPARGSRRHAFVGGQVGRFVGRPADRMARVAQAVRAGSGAVDKIMFTTAVRRPLGFDDAPAFADAPAFGSLVSAL